MTIWSMENVPEAVAKETNVIWVWWGSEQLVDDGNEVVKRTDGRERWSAGGTSRSAKDGEQHCGVEQIEGGAAIEELLRKTPIVAR